MNRAEHTRDLTRYAGVHRQYPTGWRHDVRSHRPPGLVTAPFVVMGVALLVWAAVLLFPLLHPW